MFIKKIIRAFKSDKSQESERQELTGNSQQVAELNRYDAVLYKKCYWHFLNKTKIPDGIAQQALDEIIEQEIVTKQYVTKVLRKWFAFDGGMLWKDPVHSYVGRKRTKPGTLNMQADFLAAAIANLYSSKKNIKFRLTDTLGCGEPIYIAIEPHADCPIHSSDAGKIKLAKEYIEEKPFKEIFECHCSMRWAPAKKLRNGELYEKWEASVERYRSEMDAN